LFGRRVTIRAKSPGKLPNQRAAVAALGAAGCNDMGLRRWPRVHGMAGAGAALAAMTDFNQRGWAFMAMILLFRCGFVSAFGTICRAFAALFWQPVKICGAIAFFLRWIVAGARRGDWQQYRSSRG
jgi:hypothetical protein